MADARAARCCLVFAALFLAALFLAPGMPRLAQVAGAFYRAGALAFGGGHVVLPLLHHAVVDPGWLDDNTFLAGYGAAQALPGPMFSLAAFFGQQLHGVLGATVGLLAIFLPGFLLVAGALPFWQALSARDRAARVLAGVNATVIGLLAAALYDPVWVRAVHDAKDFAIAVVAFALLVATRWPALAVVAWCVLASLIRTALTCQAV